MVKSKYNLLVAVIEPVWYYMHAMAFSLFLSIFRWRHVVSCALWCSLITLAGTVACASSPTFRTFKIGQLWNVTSGQLTSLAAITPALMDADVIYLGEEHYTPSHIQAALKILNILLSHSRMPALAMEMFSWDGQIALDQYRERKITSQKEFLRAARWSKNWGGSYQNYAPLVQYTLTHNLPLYALNPPRPLVRLVASKGLKNVRLDPLIRYWGAETFWPFPDDAEYRQVIFHQITACHKGLSDTTYERIYEASIFRDEGMASVITSYLRKKSPTDGPLVSYTGGGHIQYHVPIPQRVQKGQSAKIKDITIYLMTLDPDRGEEIRRSLAEHIADYVWLTKPGPGGPQARCG